MLEPLFNKVAGLFPATLLKRDSRIGVNITKFLRTAFSTEYWWLSLKPEAYLETRQILRRSFFAKKLNRKYLTGF